MTLENALLFQFKYEKWEFWNIFTKFMDWVKRTMTDLIDLYSQTMIWWIYIYSFMFSIATPIDQWCACLHSLECHADAKYRNKNIWIAKIENKKCSLKTHLQDKYLISMKKKMLIFPVLCVSGRNMETNITC